MACVRQLLHQIGLQPPADGHCGDIKADDLGSSSFLWTAWLTKVNVWLDGGNVGVHQWRQSNEIRTGPIRSMTSHGTGPTGRGTVCN